MITSWRASGIASFYSPSDLAASCKPSRLPPNPHACDTIVADRPAQFLGRHRSSKGLSLWQNHRLLFVDFKAISFEPVDPDEAVAVARRSQFPTILGDARKRASIENSSDTERPW
jgi:hypothetical protein